MTAPNPWQPSKQGIEEIVNVYTVAQTTATKEVFERLESFKQIPEYNRYLCYIFINLGQFVPENVRCSAGYQLKNNLLTNFGISLDEQLYLKQEALKVVGDTSDAIRRAGATLITTMICVGGLRGWPHVLPFLVECLGNSSMHVVSGAFSALRLICEDHAQELESDPSFPLNYMLPKFLAFFEHPDVQMRRNALDCILPFLHFLPVTLVANIHRFMGGFFYLAADPDPAIQKKIIVGFRILVDSDVGMNTVEIYLPQMMEYILAQMAGTDSELVLAACEFWGCLSRHGSVCNQVVSPHLPAILPVLLQRMVYTEQDLSNLGSIEDDAHIPDKPEDIRQTFGSKPRGLRDDDDDDGTSYQEWTIRKCAAEGLDYLCRPFVKRFLPVFLPLVEQGLQSPEWQVRESCILALGCVSHGQHSEMKEHLPKLVPFLFDLTRDQKPLIRSITCWVLSRYANWIILQQDKNVYFHRLVGELLTRVNDSNKEAQKAACAGLAQVSEVAHVDIIPYALAILTEFGKAFERFQRANLFALYDAVGAITVAMGSQINDERYLNVLLPPLLKKWDSLSDDDSGLFLLFDCLAQVAVALGKSFKPYAATIFNRCLKIMENALLGFALHMQDPINCRSVPEPEFLTSPMDLLSNLCEALGTDIGEYVRGSKLVPLVFEVCNSFTQPDICQSSFALVGDLARRCPDTLGEAYIPFLSIFLKGSHFTRYTGMCNNAFWAAGEIFVSLTPTKPAQEIPQQLQPFIEQFLVRSSQTLDDVDASDILETVAVVIGRICWVFPTVSIRFLHEMNQRALFISLRNARDEREKADALRGVCSVLSLDPELALKDFALVCEMLGHWHDTKKQETSDLVNAIGTLLHKYKSSAVDLWKQVCAQLPQHIKQNFARTYGL